MVGLVSPQSIVCTSRKLMFKVFSYFSQFPYKFPSQGKHLLLKSAWGKWKRRIWKTFPIFLRKDYWKKVISALLISCDSPWSENPANFRDQISNAENSMIYLQFITVNGASCNFLNQKLYEFCEYLLVSLFRNPGRLRRKWHPSCSLQRKHHLCYRL